MNEGKILDYFSLPQDPISSLFLTFSFSPDFFLNDFLRIHLNISSDPNRRLEYLTELKSKLKSSDVTVIANRRHHEMAYEILSKEIYSLPLSLGYKFEPAPFTLFHSKLYLMVYRSKPDEKIPRVRLIMGSANLTEQALRSSAETFIVFDLYDKKTGCLTVFSAVLKFIQALTKKIRRLKESGTIDHLSKILESYSEVKIGSTDAWFLHSLSNESILSQTESIMGDSSVEKLQVVSPFYEDDSADVKHSLISRFVLPASGSIYETLGELHLMFQATRHLDKFRTRIPVKMLSTLSSIERSKIKFYPIDDYGGIDKKNPEISRFMHGKLFHFQTQDLSWVLIGSPNFSNKALMLSGNQGNVETAVLLKFRLGDTPDIFPKAQNEVNLDELLPNDEPDDEELCNDELGLFVEDASYHLVSKIIKIMLSFEHEPQGDWSFSVDGCEILSNKSIIEIEKEKGFAESLETLTEALLVLKCGDRSKQIPIRLEGMDLPNFKMNYEDILLDLQEAGERESSSSSHLQEHAGNRDGKEEEVNMKGFFRAVDGLRERLAVLKDDPFALYRTQMLMQKVGLLRDKILERRSLELDSDVTTIYKLYELLSALSIYKQGKRADQSDSIKQEFDRIHREYASVCSTIHFTEIEGILNRYD